MCHLLKSTDPFWQEIKASRLREGTVIKIPFTLFEFQTLTQHEPVFLISSKLHIILKVKGTALHIVKVRQTGVLPVLLKMGSAVNF